MGLDVFIGYSADWSEYDRLVEEHRCVAYGACKDYDRARMIEDEIREFVAENVAMDMPEAWREKTGPREIGYIATAPEARAFGSVNLFVDGGDFPALSDIVSGGCDFAENDWERTFSLGAKCLGVINEFLDGCPQDPFDEERRWRLEQIYTARDVLRHLVPLAECILGTGEPRKYRVMYEW